MRRPQSDGHKAFPALMMLEVVVDRVEPPLGRDVVDVVLDVAVDIFVVVVVDVALVVETCGERVDDGNGGFLLLDCGNDVVVVDC